jgi:hypothetical protein
MPRLNRKDIDRKTNKPNPNITEGIGNDLILNRSAQTRRDDDIIRTPKRTIYDIDYAIKWFIENEIQPQIIDKDQTIPVPVIFASGEKWDNVRRLGYLRDEKGMLQSPIIVLKRNSVTERDSVKGFDANRPQGQNLRVYKSRYNERNRYEDEMFPVPLNQPKPSDKVYLVDIPKYVTVEYEMMMWCDFSTQMNDLIDQIFPYSRFAWGNEQNRYTTTLGGFSFETVNTVGEDRLIRTTVPLAVLGTLLSGQEARRSTIQKMFSPKKVVFETSVDTDIFNTTTISNQILQAQNYITQGGQIVVSSGGASTTIDANVMNYLINLTEKIATYSNATTITISGIPAINPVNLQYATKNEFDIFINGQYIDKVIYTWSPAGVNTQTIVFDTAELGYTLQSTDIIVVKGRWA